MSSRGGVPTKAVMLHCHCLLLHCRQLLQDYPHCYGA
jgi:hypothetical protein